MCVKWVGKTAYEKLGRRSRETAQVCSRKLSATYRYVNLPLCKPVIM